MYIVSKCKNPNPNDDFSGNNMSCEDTLGFPRHHTKPLTDKLMDKKNVPQTHELKCV